MSNNPSAQLEELGWGLEIDLEQEEIRLVHFSTGNTVILDPEGNLTLSGDGDINGDLNELHSLLTSALEEYGQPPEVCAIDCDEPVRIESSERISLDAPSIEFSADAELEMTSSGNLTAESSGVTTLRGALLKLN